MLNEKKREGKVKKSERVEMNMGGCKGENKYICHNIVV